VRPDGVSVTVTTPTSLPTGVSTDYGITTKRIYRAATGSTGTAFLFVAEIPLATDDYVDVLTDAELGEVLPSDIWALPPDDLRGILALPNGVMVGFRRNQLCFSAQNHPHAWPIEYRLNTDTDIVGIGNVDNTVVIGTESFVYIASGNDPAAYSMSKFEVPYAAMSKRSFAYLTGIGVVFAGTNGLMAVSGPGQVRNLTDAVFTDTQWKALDPTSMRAIAHNDIYFLFWETDALKGCYAIDMKSTGFGVVPMSFHASAMYNDPVGDTLFLVLDYDTEPDATSSTPVFLDTFTGANGTNITAHAPDTAPAGSYATPDGAMGIQSSRLVGVSGFGSHVANYAFSAPFTPSFPYTVSFTGRSFGLGSYTTGVILSGSTESVKVLLNDPTNVAVIVNNNEEFDLAVADAEHTISVLVASTEFTVTVDGVTYPPVALSASANQFDTLTATLEYPGSGQSYVDRIEVATVSEALPIPPSTPPYIEGTHIYEFEGSETEHVTYRWKSKLWLLEKPTTMLIAQVRAESYENILFRVYADGVRVDEMVITEETEFTLTAVDEYTTLQLEVLGTSPVRVLQIAEDVAELS